MLTSSVFQPLTMGGSAGKLYKAMKNPEEEHIVRNSFDAYDKDMSGSLDYAELEKFGHDCLSFLRKDSKKEHFFIRVTVRGVLKQMNATEVLFLMRRISFLIYILI